MSRLSYKKRLVMEDDGIGSVRAFGMTKRKSIPETRRSSPRFPIRRLSGAPRRPVPPIHNKPQEDSEEMALFNEFLDIYKPFCAALPKNLKEKVKPPVKQMETICDRVSRNTLRRAIASDDFWKNWKTMTDVFSKHYQDIVNEKRKNLLTELAVFRSLANAPLPGFMKSQNKTEALAQCWEQIEESIRPSLESAKQKLEASIAAFDESVQSQKSFSFEEIEHKFEEKFTRTVQETNQEEAQKPTKKPRKPSPGQSQDLRILNTKNAGLASTLRDLLCKKRVLVKKLGELQKQSDEETEDLQRMIRQMRARKAEAEQALRELENLTKEVDELTKEKSALTEEAAPLRDSLKQLESEDIKKAKDRVEVLTHANEGLSEEIGAVTARVQMKEEILTKLVGFCSADDSSRDGILKFYALQRKAYDLRRRIYALRNNYREDDNIIEQIMNEKERMEEMVRASAGEFCGKQRELQELKEKLFESRLRLIELERVERCDEIRAVKNEMRQAINNLRNAAIAQVAPLEQGKETSEDGMDQRVVSICTAEAEQEVNIASQAMEKLQTMEDNFLQSMESDAVAKAQLAFDQFEKRVVMRRLIHRDFDVKAAFERRIEKTSTELVKLRQVRAKAIEQLRELNLRLGGVSTPEDTEKSLLVSIAASLEKLGVKVLPVKGKKHGSSAKRT